MKMLYCTPIIPKNVGFDRSTGRSKDGSQLLNFAHVSMPKSRFSEYIEKISALKKKSFSLLENIFIKKFDNNSSILLSDLCTHKIGTGKTPARSAYAEDGAFLIKVEKFIWHIQVSSVGSKGSLNLVSVLKWRQRKQARKPLTLIGRDILLTSSAHIVYIAKKSDIFVGIPSFLDSPLIRL